jgi:hypothetical protein
VHGTRDLVRSLLRHLWCVGPVVLTREHVDRTSLCIDGRDARPAVPATKVEVQITVKLKIVVSATFLLQCTMATYYSVGLCAVQVPDELFVHKRSGRRHHLIVLERRDVRL